MTPKQFKARWESDDNGGGITFNEVADCAKRWGLHAKPFTQPMGRVLADVLEAANVADFHAPEAEAKP